ncbi:MAG: radical SAM protein [Erysipelotrichaceae bacterium]|nr:radical SAM protein [Erysipelotrichaceae bacterium]
MEARSLPELLQQLKEEGIPKEKYKEYIDNFLREKSMDKVVPYEGTFELTPLCNLNCKMCYVHLTQEQLQGHKLLSLDEWKSLIKQAYDLGMHKITLSGGECLTYPYFKELYSYIYSLGIETCVMTNGVLLDQYFDLFDSYPPKLVVVTLYGSDEEEYESVTGSRAYQRVMNNLMTLKEKKLQTHISITPNAFMLDGIKLVDTVHNLGFKYKINANLIEPRIDTERKNVETLEPSLMTYVQMYHEKMRLTNKEIVYRDAPDPILGELHQECGLKCPAGNSRFMVDWKGILHPCMYVMDIQTYPLNISFKSAWEQLHELSMSYKLPLECSACSYAEICDRCPGQHTNGKDGHVDKNICRKNIYFYSQGC